LLYNNHIFRSVFDTVGWPVGADDPPSTILIDELPFEGVED